MMKMIQYWNLNSFIFIVIVVFKSSLKVSAKNNTVKKCVCMEYWECIESQGQIYSYCGIAESNVCCLSGQPDPENGVTRKRGRKVDKILQCGVPSVPVTLDSQAEFKEWPWHVALLTADDSYICGGTLITSGKVITAAHCVMSYILRPSELKIRAGEHDVSHNLEQEAHTEVVVEKILLQPNFSRETLENDIAILTLKKQVKLGSHIRMVCLPKQSDPLLRKGSYDTTNNKTCVATGWGRLSEDTDHAIVLKEVLITLWRRRKCERRLRRNFSSSYKLSEKVICGGNAVDSNASLSICDGDGGGPLVCLDSEDGRWYIEGVTSFGVGCQGTESPQIFTRVASFNNWITSPS